MGFSCSLPGCSSLCPSFFSSSHFLHFLLPFHILTHALPWPRLSSTPASYYLVFSIPLCSDFEERVSGLVEVLPVGAEILFWVSLTGFSPEFGQMPQSNQLRWVVQSVSLLDPWTEDKFSHKDLRSVSTVSGQNLLQKKRENLLTLLRVVVSFKQHSHFLLHFLFPSRTTIFNFQSVVVV